MPIEPKSVAMTSCVYSADGKALLAAGCDGVVRLYGEIFFICMILITYVTGAYTNNSPITDILAMVEIKKKASTIFGICNLDFDIVFLELMIETFMLHLIRPTKVE